MIELVGGLNDLALENTLGFLSFTVAVFLIDWRYRFCWLHISILQLTLKVVVVSPGLSRDR